VKSELVSEVFLELELFEKAEEVEPPSIVWAKVEGVAVSSSAVGPCGRAGSTDSSTGAGDNICGVGSGEAGFGGRPGYVRTGSANAASFLLTPRGAEGSVGVCFFRALSLSNIALEEAPSVSPMTTSSFAGSATFCFFSSAAFFLAAARAASLEGGLEEPPSSLPDGKIGWTVMLPRREWGTLSQGVSAKKEVAERRARFVGRLSILKSVIVGGIWSEP